MASALGLLVSDQLSHGSEHVKYILNGNILWVSRPQLVKTGFIYFILGIILWRLHPKLMLISIDPQRAQKEGLKAWKWDGVFYFLFGMVIASSVQIAGILLVFSFLIVPALCAMMFFDRTKTLIFAGWILGTLASFLSITVSYFFDFPTGPTIVAGFGAILGLGLVVKRLASPLIDSHT